MISDDNGEEETFNLFLACLENLQYIDEFTIKENFKSDIRNVGDFTETNFLLYNKDIAEEARVRELAKRSIEEFSSLVRLLLYFSHIW